MRFLLHATKKVKSRSVKSSGAALLKEAAAAPNNTTNENLIKTWGQQCSPNCGCVVRFESTVDANNTIVSASYQAKKVLTTLDKNGRRQPHYTTNNAKPLLTECSCSTLHSLGKRVTDHLQGRRLDQVQNALSGISAAVVHTSLLTQCLPTSHTHCFHLVQQAVVAMVCGYLPKKPSQSYSQYLYQHYASHNYETQPYGVDENSGISVGVNIFDMAYDGGAAVEEEEQEENPEETPKAKPTMLTWQDYVDELYHQYDNGVERSA